MKQTFTNDVCLKLETRGWREMLADGIAEIEVIKSLSQNWPMLTAFLGSLFWFAKYIAHPLTVRHIAFIDAVEERDRQRMKLDAENSATLGLLRKETEETNNRLSTMGKLWKCPMEGQSPLQPHGGA